MSESSRDTSSSQQDAARGERIGVQRFGQLAQLCFALVAGIGAFTLLCWQIDSRPLGSAVVLPSPTGALSLTLLAIGLREQLFAGEAPPRLRGFAAVTSVIFAALLALHTLFAERVGLSLDLDAQLASHPSYRMATATAISAILLAISALWLRGRPHGRDLGPKVLAGIALFVALGTLAGYAYGVPRRTLGPVPIPPLSALCVTFLSLGALFARLPPDLAGLLASPAAGPTAVRRLLLGLISIPVGLGFLERYLFHRGVHEAEFGMALLVVANTLLIVSLTLRNMRAALAAQRARSSLERDLAHNRELAERYQTQEALRRSEQKYRALAVHAPVGIFEATLDGRCTFVNQRWTEITGYSEPEVLGRGWDKVVHPDDFARVAQVWVTATRDNKPFSLDFRYLTKSGQVAWVHGAAVPLDDAENKVTSLTGAVIDMSEQRRTLELLSRSEENFRALVEHAPFGVAVTRGLSVLYANRAYLDILGIDELSELAGRSLLELVHPDCRALALERARARDEGKTLGPACMRVVRKDGEVISVEGDTVAMMFDEVPAMVTVMRDVTERERTEQVRLLAERTLRESLREKDVLLKEIHHRVKNNLQVIVSLINLQASKLTDSATRQVFEETRSRVHAIALLHERLYSTKNIGRIDMRDYLAGLASDLSSSNASLRPVELRVRSDELYLEMDAAVPIGLIVNELVTNSYKHAFPTRLRRGGHIDVALEESGDQLQIVVQDDGVGYPADLDPGGSASLGMLLITSLSRQLDGEPSFGQRSEGARCVVRFPRRRNDSDVPLYAAG